MAKHALLSASGSSRWLACPPSARLELKFPKTTSTYAEEGTAAHELCELAAQYWLELIDKDVYEHERAELAQGKYYNAEMQECADDYGAAIADLAAYIRKDCPDAVVDLEVKSLDFSEWAPEGFGTGDCIIVADDILEVIDFKYGKGVPVSAVKNPQMRLYALGALNRYGALYDIKRVRMSIIQPRISREFSTEEISIEELMDWTENYVKPRAAQAFAGKGEFAPSDETCKFCRAKAQCAARKEKNLALFDDAPDSLLITLEEAAAIYAKTKDIKAWLTDLETLIMRSLFEGKAVPGWKFVEGRSNRKIVDPEKAAAALIKEGYDAEKMYKPKELVGITALEKAFGKKKIGEVLKPFIHKPAGAPKLAPVDDPRPAFTPAELILTAFDDETGEE